MFWCKGTVMASDRWWFGDVSTRMVEQSLLLCEDIKTFMFCEKIVVPYVVPFFQTHDAMIFKQDNARSHSANYTLSSCGKPHCDIWMAISISRFIAYWTHVGHSWNAHWRRNDVNNVRQLEAALLEKWANIPFVMINKLINNMRKHCTAVIGKNVCHTRYWGLCDF